MPLTPLVGREGETAAVMTLLRRADVRLVTLTGPGGIGKTRLALHVAAQVANDFPEWVVFVSLASISSGDHVLSSVAHAVGVREARGRSLLNGLVAALANRPRLLILDNFEGVVAAAPEIAALLAACPGLKALATSRTLLRIAGERVYPVPPLPLPEPAESSTPDRLAQSAAVQLFVDRAAAVDPAFGLTEATAPLVATICRRLDGLPLAIELAAARMNHLPLSILLARLERRLPLLIGGPRDHPPRHQTLRSAIAWSYDLLTPDEQAPFCRLAVFAGGFTLDAAEQVMGGVPSGPRSSPFVLDGLTSLVDKSLVQLSPLSSGVPSGHSPR